MKLRSFALACSFLFVITSLSTQAVADAFCSDPAPYQYQNCGVVAPENTFTANVLGLGINMLFYGYHADFSSSINALVFRNSTLVYTGPDTPLNTAMHQWQFFNLVPRDELQSGDQIELVLHVNDPNGNQDYYSSELSKNIDGLNHTWAESLTNGQRLIVVARCTFVGFEDLPMQEDSDFDYNDFKAFIFGMHVDSADVASTNSVPEPSSIVLLSGVPVAFLARKLRHLL